MPLDFASLAASLLSQADTLVPNWLPNGKRQGREWAVGGLDGSAGDSCKINLSTGVWMDFATGQKGGDLIDLYAQIHRLEPGQAYRELAGDDAPVRGAPTNPQPKRRVIDQAPAERPPPDAGEPPAHYKHGSHVKAWPYVDSEGALLYWVARYETPEGEGRRKDYAPWSWIDGKWQAKGYPRPRPLYGLDRLAQAPAERRVMLVEGEKACDALAPVLARSHVVMTWAGGAKALATADFSPLAGRRVDLWPDNDLPGREAMAELAPMLYGMGCRPVRTIVPEGQSDGWDAADAIADGWDKTRLVEWIGREGGKYLVTYEPPAEPEVESEQTAPPSDDPASAPVPRAPTAVSVRDERSLWQSLGLETNVGNGTPPANEATAYQALLAANRPYWFDTFRQAPMTGWDFIDGKWVECPAREVEESDFTALTLWFQTELRLHKITTARVKPAVLLYAASRRRNCAQEWLSGLHWDGTPRLDMLFARGFGAADSDYHRAVSKNFLMGMCARVMNPGCQLDYMPILQGVQGNKKSSAFRVIGGEWFTEMHSDIKHKDFFQDMRGMMLCELTELDQMERGSTGKLKGIITNRVDTYRVPYEAKSRGFKRQCVLIGATNRDDWNKDDTGARRFWPVKCSDIDIVWLTLNREQLFAEAMARYTMGECYWQVPDEEAKRLQDEARERELWHEAIAQYIASKTFVTPAEILVDAVGKALKDQNKADNARVCAVLRLEGWVKSSQWYNGKSRTAWRRGRIENGPEIDTGAGEAVEPVSLSDQWSSEM